MKARSLLVGLVVVLAAATLVAGQSSSAPPLSVTTTTLYAHHAAVDTAELEGWMNTLAEDGDDMAMGPAASCTPHSGNRAVDEELLSLVGTEIDRTYTFILSPAQRGYLELKRDENVTTTIHAGAGSCFGLVHFASTLSSGNTTIANGSIEDHWYDNTADVYPSVELTMELNESVAVIDDLVWTIHVTGETGGALFLGISEAKGSTRMDLPVVGVTETPPGAAQDLPSFVDLSFEFPEPTDAANNYNWSSPGGPHQLIIETHLEAGSVAVRLEGPDGTIFSETLKGEDYATTAFDAAAEPHDLSVNFTDAVGTANVTISPYEPGKPGPNATGGTSSTTPSYPANTTGSTTNATDNGTAEDTKGDEELMPVPYWIPFLAAVGAIVLWKRRR